MNKLFAKSCEKMDEVADESVDLVVTSPPYWNAIDYEQHVADSEAWYRTRRGEPYEEYLDWLKVCFTEIFRTQKPGGFCAVVIGTVLLNGRQYPVPQHLVVLMEKIGYEYHQEIVWHKVTGGVRRAGVTIQHPYPGYYHPNIMSESILVFRKPGPRIYKSRSQVEKEANQINIDAIFTREIANNVWHIAPVPPNYLPHPCPFPEEIPYRLILLYSYAGDLVLDPFLGIGTTAKVAEALGRRYVGYEIQEKYLAVAHQRLQEALHLRDQLITRFDKLPVQDRQFLEHLHQQQAKARQLTFVGLGDRKPGAEYTAKRQEGMQMDYEALTKKAPWLREHGHKMIISSDLDGILSGALLTWLLDWKIVGFYDTEKVWVLSSHRDFLSGSCIFIDHDIHRRNIRSIGHHMLQFSRAIPIPGHTDPDAQSVNPNLIRGFNCEEHFDRKYPFATIHFLLCCYNAWGDLEGYRIPRDFLPLLLHSDSSLKNAAVYQSNAIDWLDWLGNKQVNRESPIYPLCSILCHTPPRRLLEWGAHLGDKMIEIGFGRTSQCRISNPTNKRRWKRFKELFGWIAEVSNWTFDWPDFPTQEVECFDLGKPLRLPATPDGFKAMIAGEPFSFAIISRDKSKENGGVRYTLLPDTIGCSSL